MICVDQCELSLLSTPVSTLLYESILDMLMNRAIRVWFYRKQTKIDGRLWYKYYKAKEWLKLWCYTSGLGTFSVLDEIRFVYLAQ